MPIPQTHVPTAQGFSVQAPLQSTQDSEPLVSILPATNQLIGAVKPDGTTITVASDGTISAAGGGGSVTAVTGVAPIASTGGTTPAISVAAATSLALGVVRPDGTIITVSAGAITVPEASSSVFGVVKVDGTTITAAAGVISAVGGGGGVTAVTGVAPIASTGGATPAISVAAATSGALGVVQPDGTIITVSAGAITVPEASSSVFGVVKVDGTTITAAAGVISAANVGTVTAVSGVAPIASTGGATPAISVAAATSGALGVVRPDGTIITVTAGAITVPEATSSVFGVVKVDGTTITAAAGVISAVGGGALTRIAQTVLSSPAPNVTFSSIPATFTQLLLIITARSAHASNEDNVLIQYNGDAGANYDWQLLEVSNITVTGAEATAQTTGLVGIIPAASATANYAASLRMDLPGYAGTTFFKSGISHNSSLNGTISTNDMWVQQHFWQSTAAINAINLILSSAGNFATGSVFTLYGLS